MANRIWSRGINRESCQTGGDPWSSTPDGSRIPKYTDGQMAKNIVNSNPNRGQRTSKTNNVRVPPTSKGRNNKSQDNHCRGYNSAAGCSQTSGQCKFKHVCNRSINSNNNKTDHNADTHV